MTIAEVETTPELLSLVADDPAELADAVANVRIADLADALNRLPIAVAARIVSNLPFDTAVEALTHPELDRRQEIVGKMERGVSGALVTSMAPDQRADLLRELPARKRAKVLATIDPPARAVLEKLLAYPRDAAGAIMSTEFVAVDSDATVADAIGRVREFTARRDAEPVHAVYVSDSRTGTLVRVVELQDLISAQPAASICIVGDGRHPLSTPALARQEDVARVISKYNLVALPVVDEGGRMIGTVTVDDVIDSMVRATTEDVQKFGGLEALDEPYLRVSAFGMFKKRAGWLAVLFLGEMLTATAMGHFADEISKAVVLSLFIPLIISSGGNAGSQATSLIIRALALRELSLRDWWRVALRELPSGLALGAVLGIIGVIRIYTWQRIGWYDYGVHFPLIAATIGLALVGVVTFGSLAGSMLPFLLKRVGFDPASASAPLVATLVDVTGLVIYFTVAYAILRGTLL